LHRSLALARRERDTAPSSLVESATPVESGGKPGVPPVVTPVLGEEEDDLKAIKGLGPKAAQALNAGGVTRYAQIAAWTDDDVAQWDTDLNARGRIVRDDWVGQAKTLTVR
ncbi:MAG: hypothetical protein CMF74_02490, partial [Maricaulis sp.]|nr:hypothetical protein [Maricaulis sp.]